ncbi:MAG: hypothetical protein PHI15_03935 [Methanomicrobium sp.]|nr:hypothetical protein [Methanomicrobium sp.]
MTIDPVVYGNVMLTAIAVLLLLLLFAVLMLSNQMRNFIEKTSKTKEKKATTLNFKKIQQENISDSADTSTERSEDSRKKDSNPSLIYTSDSIQENLLLLFRHYSLKSFTMATSDGLVISSTEDKSTAEADAANYSYMYQKDSQPESDKIRLIGIPYKGKTVVGIIKSDSDLSKTDLLLIEKDIRFILGKNM